MEVSCSKEGLHHVPYEYHIMSMTKLWIMDYGLRMIRLRLINELHLHPFQLNANILLLGINLCHVFKAQAYMLS